ncbi:MAG: protein kinase [bacterium]
MSLNTQVGPYLLDKVIGHGGTSTVWLAKHRDLGSDVVLKVLTAKFTKRARFREYFANEIRAVARLNHPNIARVLDAGVEHGGGSSIPAGSPYVVMEYIPGGCLYDIGPEMNWPTIRDVLLVLLDALAHAHAHDVVHLDLKPANVLLRSDGMTVSPVLTDFGISRTEDSMAPTERSGVVGTPKYMAPEQIRGEWRRTGPATDLYALGCMAFQMVTGRVPYEGPDSYAVLRAHLKDALPDVSARISVPASVVGWIRRLLEKEPSARFESAADAAFALIQTDSEPRDQWLEPDGSDAPRTIPVELTVLDETLNIQAIRESVDTLPTRLRSPEAPPMPISWQRRGDFRRDVRALGLGLVRDRVPPVVGRVEERDRLWAALADAYEGAPRAVLIKGEVGVGTTRIAEWMARLAEEVGAAQSLMVRSSPSALEGIAHAIGRKLKVAGGKAMDAVPIVRELLIGNRPATEDDLVDAIVLSDLMTGTPSGATLMEKRTAVMRALSAMSKQRVVIVVCDNVEHLRDIWTLARLMFDEGIPALLLAATNAQVLPELEAILSHPAVEEMRLTPLPDDDIADMANQLVWMNEATVDALVRKADGYPGRAVQWLTSWVERDLLMPTPQGFQMRRRAMDESLSDAAQRAAEVVLAQFSAADQRALGVAATFGTRFNTQMWFDTMALLKISPQPDLLERAVRLGLLDRDTEGREYEFSDLLLFDTFLEGLARDGLQAQIHEACAQILTQTSGKTRDPARLERLVNHWSAAGRFEEALPILSWIALRNFHEDNIDDARRLLAWHETLLSRADVTTRKREGWMGDIIRLWLREGDGDAVPDEMVEAAYEGALKARQLVAAAEAVRLRAKILRGVSIDSANEVLESRRTPLRKLAGVRCPRSARFG